MGEELKWWLRCSSFGQHFCNTSHEQHHCDRNSGHHYSDIICEHLHCDTASEHHHHCDTPVNTTTIVTQPLNTTFIVTQLMNITFCNTGVPLLCDCCWRWTKMHREEGGCFTFCYVCLSDWFRGWSTASNYPNNIKHWTWLPNATRETDICNFVEPALQTKLEPAVEYAPGCSTCGCGTMRHVVSLLLVWHHICPVVVVQVGVMCDPWIISQPAWIIGTGAAGSVHCRGTICTSTSTSNRTLSRMVHEMCKVEALAVADQRHRMLRVLIKKDRNKLERILCCGIHQCDCEMLPACLSSYHSRFDELPCTRWQPVAHLDLTDGGVLQVLKKKQCWWGYSPTASSLFLGGYLFSEGKA